MMADLPDMSHLTPEERQIIENVMMRQKQEEEREKEIMRRKQDEIHYIENSIRVRSAEHKKAGAELDATCEICIKTKFADGIGHLCDYCHIRCCARCGGKVTLRSNKSLWVCILCRKRQELFSKTGQWMFNKKLCAADTAILIRMQEDMQAGQPGLTDLNQDKKPRLERAHSAAEKENLPLLQRSSSLLRRQYSQQEQIPTRRMSTSDSGVEMSMSPHSRSLPTPHVVGSSYSQQTPRHQAAYPEDDPTLYRGELDVIMRQHAQTYQRTRQIYQENSDISMGYPHTGVDTSRVHPTQQHSVHQVPGGHPSQQQQQQQPVGSVTGSLHQQRSFSSSEEERSTPECASDEPDESEKGKGYYHSGGTTPMSTGTRRHGGGHHNGHHVTGSMTIEYNGHHPPREPRKEESTLVRRSFRRSGDEWRSDSRRFTERRGKKQVRFDGGTNVAGAAQDDWSWEADRQGSQDSATKDSGIDTSSTFTSSEDSNRGDLPKQPSWQESSDGTKMIGHMSLRKTGSSILGLKVVGGWELEDGRIGALVEKVKKGSTADVEGQLRPGDEVIEWNGICLQGKSFEEVCDIIAASKNASEVELYVSRDLCGPTTTPMMTGMPTTTMPMTSRRIAAQAQWRQKLEPVPMSQQPHHKELYDVRRDKPSVLVTSPGSPDLHAQGRGRHPRQHQVGDPNVGGNIQVQLEYEPVGLRFIVTIISAAGLRSRNNGQERNAYARIYLLPDRTEATKKRTKNVPNANDPRWNQTFVYNVRKSELKYRALEVSVWDNVNYVANDFLGEAIIELAYFNDKPQWYPLHAHEDRRSHIGQHPEGADDMTITPIECHLSPPSTTSRLSDSDTSEYDITDGDMSQQRRGADGASISSIGSSSRFHNVPSNYKRHYSSPPPERDLCMDNEHRSRRDMSPQGRKRAALMISRDQPVSMSMSGYSPYRKDDISRGMMGHRSHSAAPMDSPNLHYRGRSQSPTGHRSLSPPEHRSMPYSHGYMPKRFGSRSATATPTGSPKKRQLPQIPATLNATLKERVAQDMEERARLMRHRNKQVHTTYRSTEMGGWERHYSGLSDSDLLSIGHDTQPLPHRMHRSKRGHLSPEKDVLRDFGDSDMESIGSVASSAFSTQSERPRGTRNLIDYSSQSSSYEKTTSRHTAVGDGHNGHSKRGQFTRSLSNADAPQDEKADGSLSDTAVGLHVEEAARRTRKSSPGSKSGSSSGGGSAVQYQAGLGKKSNSTSQLSATGGTCVGEEGRKRRLGFGKKGKSSFTVHRSEEVLPEDAGSGRCGRQPSSASSDGEGSGDGDSWPGARMLTDSEHHLSEFIDGLGPGQLVGRQALGAPSFGDIQLSIKYNKGYLEVEVIRAKDLQLKPKAGILPSPYVKMYLVKGRKCLEKQKTTTARATREPFYQQSLAFKEDIKGCFLQVSVWGDHCSLGTKKDFVGVAQILLDDLNLSDMVFGWYKLFNSTSLVSEASSSILSRRSSAASLDSLKS